MTRHYNAGNTDMDRDPIQVLHTDRSAVITLNALVTARWVLLALVGLGLLADFISRYGGPSELSLFSKGSYLLPAFAVFLMWLTHNLYVTFHFIRRENASDRLAGLHLLIDVVAISCFLALSGGPANPFTILYFVPITLATQISPAWTWVLSLTCLLCFGLLFLLTPSDLSAHAVHSAHGNHMQHGAEMEGGSAFQNHMVGMWFAFGIAGAMLTYFVHNIAMSLSSMSGEIHRLRQGALENRHLAALGTLATGAAHELGTPLATIGLLSDDMDRLDAEEQKHAMQTIRLQLDRCRSILGRMSNPELRVLQLSSSLTSWKLQELEPELLEVADGIPLHLRSDNTDIYQVREVFRSNPPRADPKCGPGLSQHLIYTRHRSQGNRRSELAHD